MSILFSNSKGLILRSTTLNKHPQKEIKHIKEIIYNKEFIFRPSSINQFNSSNHSYHHNPRHRKSNNTLTSHRTTHTQISTTDKSIKQNHSLVSFHLPRSNSFHSIPTCSSRPINTQSYTNDSKPSTNADKTVMNYDKYSQMLLQQVFLLKMTVSNLKEEKEMLIKERNAWCNKTNEEDEVEARLHAEIKSYRNISNNCKENCMKLIEEIELMKDDMEKYDVNPSPLLNYLSEMITEPVDPLHKKMHLHMNHS